eukprot:COSAG02_NODE_47704_length_336_cov_0.783333_1_plen_79_part_01
MPPRGASDPVFARPAGMLPPPPPPPPPLLLSLLVLLLSARQMQLSIAATGALTWHGPTTHIWSAAQCKNLGSTCKGAGH